jgi:autotransporter passenger strand-loop-strand repeat protein
VSYPQTAFDLPLHIYQDHLPNFIANQVENPQNIVAGVTDPNYVAQITEAFSQAASAISHGSQQIINFTAAVISGTETLFDPPTGTDFVLGENLGSPYLASIALPFLAGVQAYEVRYETGSTWGAYQQIAPGSQYVLGAQCDGVEFDALGSSGQPIHLPSDVIFEAAFASSGVVSGTLAVTNATQQPPLIVSSGQTLVVSTGEFYSDITVLGGGTVDVLSGGATSGTIICSGGSEIVSSGGTSVNAVVLSGGLLDVLSGGLADPTTIYTGGSETVLSGGTDLGALISGGTQFACGLASGVTIFAGSQVVESGGTASGTLVVGGAFETVSAGGTDFGTQISGGTQDVFGLTRGAMLPSGIRNANSHRYW